MPYTAGPSSFSAASACGAEAERERGPATRAAPRNKPTGRAQSKQTICPSQPRRLHEFLMTVCYLCICTHALQFVSRVCAANYKIWKVYIAIILRVMLYSLNLGVKICYEIRREGKYFEAIFEKFEMFEIIILVREFKDHTTTFWSFRSIECNWKEFFSRHGALHEFVKFE